MTNRMLLAVAAIALAACHGSDAAPKPKTAFSGTSALQYAQQQYDFGPRVPNTEAARKAGDWIIAQMKQRADTVIVQSFDHVTPKGDTLHLRNILARWKPSAAQHVLYLTHWDTRPTADEELDPANRTKPIPGANDGAAGVGLFLALGDQLKKTPPAVGVDLLFVDGEDYGSFDTYSDTASNPDVLIGSTYFANHLPSPDYKPLFGVLWDMIADKHLQIYQELNSTQYAPEVVSKVWQQAADFGYDKEFIPQAKLAVIDDHVPLLKKGLHVIDVLDIDYCVNGGTDCEQPGTTLHHTLSDTMDKISARSLQIVGDVALALVQQ